MLQNNFQTSQSIFGNNSPYYRDNGLIKSDTSIMCKIVPVTLILTVYLDSTYKIVMESNFGINLLLVNLCNYILIRG